MTRFIGEIESHVDIIENTKKIPKKGLFDGSDEDKKKEAYSVTKIVEMMTGKRIEALREAKLIPNTKLDTTQLFTDPLSFIDVIKKNVFESDYGIYCDYYLTRQLMINNKQPIKDVFVESILLNLHLTDEEKSLYQKYDIKSCLLKKIIPTVSSTTDNKLLKDLIQKIRDCMQLTGLDAQGIQQLLSMGMQDYHYPQSFMKKLRESYLKYKDPMINKDESKSSVYYISLCAKFSNDRRRLVYRDIYEFYKENSTLVFPRIDEYVELLKTDEILCKLHMNKLYKIGKHSVSFVGELDYLNITKNTIVDIKCSEGEFKVEWMLQLLLYYSLFMCNPMCCPNYDDIQIKFLAIFNVFNGKYYQITIPEDYNWIALLEFVQLIISDDLKGIRPEQSIELRPEQNDIILTNDNKIKKTIKKQKNLFITQAEKNILNTNISDNINITKIDESINVDHMLVDIINNEKIITEEIYQYIEIPIVDPEDKSGYIVFDVENNCINQDIIQLAYIVYNNNHKIMKKSSSYVKDRFVDSLAGQITGITTDQIRKYGIQFDKIITDFFIDLSMVLFVCGHHVSTDISKITANLQKFKIKPSYNPLDEMSVSDTLTLYKVIKGKGKLIKLSELYNELTGLEMKNAHDALSDVEHTAKCYVILQKLIKDNNLSDNLNKITKTKEKVTKTKQIETKIVTKIVRKLKPSLFSSIENNNKEKEKENKVLKDNDNKEINKSNKKKLVSLEGGLTNILDTKFF